MKTLTLHINENIYDEVKRFLSLFSSDKLKVEEHTHFEDSSAYFDKKEVEEINAVLEEFNAPPIPINKKISKDYDVEDFEKDMKNIEKIYPSK